MVRAMAATFGQVVKAARILIQSPAIRTPPDLHLSIPAFLPPSRLAVMH